VSIDGNKELHDACRIDLEGKGTYDRAIAAVNDYKTKFHGNMGSKMTISPENITKLSKAVIDMIENNKYTHINLNCVFEEGWNNEHAKILYYELNKITDWLIENDLQDEIILSIFDNHYIGKRLPEENNNNWCGGTGYMLSTDCDGNLYPCQRYSPASIGDKQPLYIIGDLECGIGKCKEHLDRINCLNCITRRSQSTDECFNCPIAGGCAWCSAYNYEVFGTPDKRATFICCMHKARVLANMYRWWKQGKEYEVEFPEDWAIEIIGKEEYDKLLKLQIKSEIDI
jgi:radical SAM peptide maturase (CXXX-repeat target family)